MPRFQPADDATLTPAQRQVVDEVRRGRRGTVPANVLAWLPSPDLARRAAALGELVRYESSLVPRLSELAILVVARHWNCAYEWAIHVGEARQAGVAESTIAAIGRGAVPALDDLEAAVEAFARELVATGRVGDATHDAVRLRLGDPGIVDLVAIVGYYTLVAFTLNARLVPSPADAPQLPERGVTP